MRPLLIVALSGLLYSIGSDTSGAPIPTEKPVTHPIPLAKPSFESDLVSTLKTPLPLPLPKPVEAATVIALDTEVRTPVPMNKPAPPLGTVSFACWKIAGKLRSVDERECLRFNFALTDGRSVLGFPIISREVGATTEAPQARVLMVGGTHGDEYTSISVIFKWLGALLEMPERRYRWLVVPVLNPDGLLRPKSTRTNANGVDLNRNLPTPNWHRESEQYWVNSTSRNPRKYPGAQPLSEPENRWLVERIAEFRPDVIITTHAPHGVVDFDGPPHGPKVLGNLSQRLLGTFPGSLGNYAGLGLEIPVVTVEFSSAGTMPHADNIAAMWADLHLWLDERFSKGWRLDDRLRADAGEIDSR